jgi:hypothetical protein
VSAKSLDELLADAVADLSAKEAKLMPRRSGALTSSYRDYADSQHMASTSRHLNHVHQAGTDVGSAMASMSKAFEDMGAAMSKGFKPFLPPEGPKLRRRRKVGPNEVWLNSEISRIQVRV